MNGQVVVDASLAAKWLVNEVHTEKALSCSEELGHTFTAWAVAASCRS